MKAIFDFSHSRKLLVFVYVFVLPMDENKINGG